ncbi:MAG: hypothetical protein OXD29_04610, partial [Roseovarius sp.]|nr:hypothetical protein [Roseovarius sp.]
MVFCKAFKKTFGPGHSFPQIRNRLFEIPLTGHNNSGQRNADANNNCQGFKIHGQPAVFLYFLV